MLKPPRCFVAIAALAIIVNAWVGAQGPTTRITRQIEWQNRGVWLKADLHAHTRFSDGGHTVQEVAIAARRFGCDVLAITDHSADEDKKATDLKSATPAYVQSVRDARQSAAGLTIITGLEWNMPPGQGNEHATVLFPTTAEDSAVLGQFKSRFDGWNKPGDTRSLAPAALTWLRSIAPAGPAPVVIVGHPSRRPNSPNAPRLTFADLHRSAASLLVGFEGAPGHQRTEPFGAYDPAVKPIDRWDPITAKVGGDWDEWLRAGLDVWGAAASSDFHHEDGDYWPCEFARTWIYAPDRTADGVLRALRAGAFYGEHGQITSAVRFEIRLDAARIVTIGEAAQVPSANRVTAMLQLTPTARDYAGRESRIDEVELIGISGSGAKVLFAGGPPASGPAFTVPVVVLNGGIALRARGRRRLADGSSLMFYTNPIRLTTPPR